MPTQAKTIPQQAFYTVLNYMKSHPDARKSNPAELSRSKLAEMVRTRHPDCTLTSHSVDRLYQICQIIGGHYEDPNRLILVEPDLNLKWRPTMLLINGSKAIVLHIRLMTKASYMQAENWQAYDTYQQLPEDKRPRIDLATAAHAILNQMENLESITALTQVCVVGFGKNSGVIPEDRILGTFTRT